MRVVQVQLVADNQQSLGLWQGLCWRYCWRWACLGMEEPRISSRWQATMVKGRAPRLFPALTVQLWVACQSQLPRVNTMRNHRANG